MYLHAISTANPPASFAQAECLALAAAAPQWKENLDRRSRLMLSTILRGDSGIQRRQFAARDINHIFSLDADELNEEFRQTAPALALDALAPALRQAGVEPAELDALVVCTCTGYLCPGVSSYLAEQLGLRDDAWLQDLVGLGCGAAIPALRATDAILAAQPDAIVACVAVEICSAAFYLDNDPGVIISACLFGDGAAATVWRAQPGPRPLRCHSFDTHHDPAARDRIRFEQRNGKLRNLLHPSVPALAAGAALTPRFLTAAERTRSIGANDRIRIAQIGVGSRGKGAHLEKGIIPHLAATNFEVVAIADPWKQARSNTNALIKATWGREAKEFESFQDLLAMEGIDAVMIASPDFHHTTHLEAVAKARKHIYVEKPLATEMDKLVRAYDAAKAAQAAGSIIQVGTQLRSLPGIVGARQLVKDGVIGKITRIDETRNSEKPYWYSYLNREVKKEDVNWKEFLGDRKARPFNAAQYSAWYGYYEFCQGPVPQWGAHFLDLMHYVTGCGLPESCMCMGGVTYWKDENNFTAPDNVIATWNYPEGFMVTSSNNFGNFSGNSRKFYGDKGTLAVDNWNAPTYSADGGPKRDGKIRGKMNVELIPSPDHFLNWLQCMRDGKTPNANIDAGYQHAVAVLMAVISYDTGKKTFYDSVKRTIRTA